MKSLVYQASIRYLGGKMQDACIWIQEGFKYLLNLDNIKKIIDILSALTAWIAIIIGILAAWGIFLMSSRSEISLDHVIYWPNGITKSLENPEDESEPSVSIQIRLLNPAVGSKVVSEFWLEPLVIELNKQSPEVPAKPYLFLKPLVCKNKIVAEIEDLYHPFTMVGQEEKVKHIVFIPESSLFLDEGCAILKLSIKYKIYNPVTRPFRTPKDQIFNLQYAIDPKLLLVQ